MTKKEAIKEIRSKRDREWIRWDGRDWLAEYEAKQIIAAARILVKELSDD